MKTESQINSNVDDAQPCPKVPYICVTLTPGVDDLIPRSDVAAALLRHRIGDWGDINEEARRENDIALLKEGRLISSYWSSNGYKYLIITRADRTLTTVLLTSEY